MHVHSDNPWIESLIEKSRHWGLINILGTCVEWQALWSPLGVSQNDFTCFCNVSECTSGHILFPIIDHKPLMDAF